MQLLKVDELITKSGEHRVILIGLADSENEWLEAKQLDDLAFQQHHGISMEELTSIVKSGGAIILIREKETRQLIAEAQILFRQIDQLSYILPDREAFNYGVAVNPDFQGCGLGKKLIQYVDLLATEGHSETLSLTVRAENYTSIKLHTDLGFRIVGYLPNFYGNNPSNARLLMKKPAGRSYEDGLMNTIDVERVPVHYGDTHDPYAHGVIWSLIAHGYQGVSADRHGLTFKKLP